MPTVIVNSPYPEIEIRPLNFVQDSASSNIEASTAFHLTNISQNYAPFVENSSSPKAPMQDIATKTHAEPKASLYIDTEDLKNGKQSAKKYNNTGAMQARVLQVFMEDVKQKT